MAKNVIVQAICVKSCELQAFKEHLQFHHLKHAIIIITQEDKFKKTSFTSFFGSQYYLAFLNTNNRNKPKHFNQLLNGNAPRVGLFMHYTPSDQTKLNILLSASMDTQFNYSLSWFIVMEDNAAGPLEIIRQNFGHLNLMLNADVTVVMDKENCTLDFYDIYKICHTCGTPLEMEHKGIWAKESGLRIREKFKDTFVTRRNNFKNTTVKVATALLNYSPDINMTRLEYLEDNKHLLQNDFMQRKTYNLVKLTQSLYNFSFHLEILDSWGVYTNGNWTGVVASIKSGDVEFSVCPLRFVHERIVAARYSPELHVETIRFLFRHPKRASIRNIFFEPLADTVWWCVLALIVISASLLTIHIRAECKLYCKSNCSPSSGEPQTTLDFVVFTVLETVFMQGPPLEPFRSNSTRILLTSVSVFSILIMQFYGAYIVSSLLSEPPRTISNLAALYNSSLEIGMENVSYNFELFKTATNPVVRNIYHNRICKSGSPRALTLEQGMQRIAKGGFAMHVSLDRAYRFLENILTESQFCDLQEITFNAPFSSSLGFGKLSPYSKFISTAILKFRESSLLQYNNKQWEIKKIDCAAVQNNDVEVDLVHFAPVLIFLVFAILTATWIFIMENLVKRIPEQIRMSFKNICKTMRK